MIRSMTGFGRASTEKEGREITVEIKAVNHRFFEFSARVPRSLGYLEERLKRLCTGSVNRGKTELSVQLAAGGSTGEVQVNEQLATSYIDALRGLSAPLGLQDDLTLSTLCRFSDIFMLHRPDEDQDALWEEVKVVAEAALEAFCTMRQQEGERLVSDILEKLATIETLAKEVEAQSPKTVENYRARLHERMQVVLADRGIEESRLLTEAAIFAERIAVDEETVRLGSHIAQFRSILAGEGPVGRKLDFLVQEMNREINTIGSKAQDLSVAGTVVELKSQLEKIREQIQNIE